jgi:hypothetical protein
MQRFLVAAFPGLWLGLWQYGVLAVAWFVLIRPARLFFNPTEIGPEGLGYVALALMVGAASSVIFLIDSAMYASTLHVGFIRRATVTVLAALLASLILTIVWGGGFLYAGNCASTPFQRWAWIILYGVTVSVLLVAHFHVIWRFRSH